MKISEMNYEQIETRLSQMPKPNEMTNLTDEVLNKHLHELQEIEARKLEIKNNVEARKKLEQRVIDFGKVIPKKGAKGEEMRDSNEEEIQKKEIEVRALQNYIHHNALSVEERSSLTTTSSGAFIPTHVQDTLLTSEKYSDLLRHATHIKNENANGETKIPLMSAFTSAVWKTEGATVPSAIGAITELVLKGYELMRLITISAAADSMSSDQFEQLLLNLLSEETIETLEESFIKGTGVNQPTGLDSMDLSLKTVTAVETITVKDVAKAISKLPNKYARNAIIMGNSATLFELSLLVSQNDAVLATGVDSFLKKEIVPNEHVKDNEIYIVDRSQLYVKFAKQIQIASDVSRGFREAEIDIRALAVVDAKWNPYAVAKVIVGV